MKVRQIDAGEQAHKKITKALLFYYIVFKILSKLQKTQRT